MRLNVRTLKNDEESVRELLLGKVTKVADGNGDYADKVLNITIEGTVWNKDEKKEETKSVDISFWNSEYSQMRDRAKNAKIAVGSVILCDVTKKSDKYYANNFMYRGEYNIPETAENREVNIFMGPVCGFQDTENCVRFSIPVEDRDKNTDWKHITVWPPREEGKTDLASRARKVLAPKGDKKPQAVVICSEPKPYISNSGEERCSYTGYDFILI